jgi:crossover junction endodeoxyribonuclease RuvC
MVKMLLGLPAPPSPHDAADALAVAICHVHSFVPARLAETSPARTKATSWRKAIL